MASTPWRKSGASTLFSSASDSPSYSPSKKVPLKKGLFADGIWHCNCTPRLPASRFQVKKEGPNKGRWFYTCQKPEREKGCGFFLWGDEAKGREMRAVIGGSRSELEADADIWRGEEKLIGEGGRGEKPSTKLMAEIETDDDDEEDEFGEWPLELEEEKRIVQAVSTPRKMQVGGGGEFATPGKRKWEETLATPITGKRDRDEDIFTAPSNKRFKVKEDSSSTPNPSSSLRTPSATPTPAPGHLDLNLNPDSTPKPQQTFDITPEILSLLHSQKIDEEIREELKEVLGKHALRINGIVRGRDISRVALRKKDERIAELEGVVARLEREREVDRGVIKCLKGDVKASVEKRGRGRGRGGGRGRG